MLGRSGWERWPPPDNSKRARLKVPALQTPPKFHEKIPGAKRNFGRSGGGGSGAGVSGEGGPAEGG